MCVSLSVCLFEVGQEGKEVHLVQSNGWGSRAHDR